VRRETGTEWDLWAERWRHRDAQGNVILVRYADDIVVGFEHRGDAERFLAEMRERVEKFALSLHPHKTRLIEFGCHAARDRGPAGVLESRKPSTFWASPTSAAAPVEARSSCNAGRAGTG
jgi:hypothetical protein